jgi:putative ABC transport system permease protein
MRLAQLLYTVPLRLRSLFQRRQVEQDLDDEIRYHIERRIEEEIARGIAPGEARRIALRAMDGLEQHKEECRDMRRTQFVEQLLRDVRYAWRSLGKSPGFVAVTLLSLALGIGANTAIFSLIDKLLLESLPVERPRELVMLNPQGMRGGWTAGRMTWSYPAYAGIRDQQRVFTGVLAERTDTVNFSIDGSTQRATETIVSGNYFDVLGVRPLIGRVLSPADDRTRGGHPVVVLSHGFWVEQLGGSADIVGHSIRLNGYPFTVVGVSEKGFNGLEIGGSIDVMVPAAMLGQVVTYSDALDSRDDNIFNVYGRLKPGVSREQAQAQLQPAYRAQLEQDVAAMARPPKNDKWKQGTVTLEDGHRGTSGLRSDLETPLTALMAMTGLVLLIACANIAGLLMARSASRAKEISIRLAIGASRGRIVRQLFTESALLSVLGGVAGLLVAWWTINLLLAEIGDATRFKLVTSFLDVRVLGFACGASLLTGVLFGLLPALHASRESVSATLKTGTGPGRGQQVRLRKALVTAQVAMGLVLITAAGLFLRTLSNLRHTDTGFRPDRMVQFDLNAGLAGYDRSQAIVLFHQILDELRALPGVSGASLAVKPILSGGGIRFGLDLEGYANADKEMPMAYGDAVAPGHFSLLGMGLVRGRDFTEADAANAPRVAIVNQAFVKEYFPDRDPLGQTIGLNWGGPTRYLYEVVGVCQDARTSNLRDEPQPGFVIPYTQWNVLTGVNFLVQSSLDPAALAGSVRELVRRHDANIPVVAYRTINEQIDRLLRPERLVASLSLAFGLLAIGLAAIGLYGVTAFSVARRTREIGIRMALGAQRAAVLKMVLRDVAAMAAVGIALGVGLSLGLGRYVESQLYGVPARDAQTVAGAAALLAAVALASGWLPARRASRVDPVRALRQE